VFVDSPVAAAGFRITCFGDNSEIHAKPIFEVALSRPLPIPTGIVWPQQLMAILRVSLAGSAYFALFCVDLILLDFA